MRKFNLTGSLFIFLLIMLLSASALTSCGKSLPAPQNLTIDEENLLSWDAVESARIYNIEVYVTGTATDAVFTKKTSKTNCSLDKLEAGDYDVRIMATGGAENDLTSDWSAIFAFHRDYETGCVYELINNGTEYQITRGSNASGVVLIESTYRGKPVTAIADNAFKGNRRITEVVLGDNIRTIGESAFYNCGELLKVTMTDSVTSIGDSTFQGCRKLTEVVLSKNLDAIPDFCFTYCRSLTAATIYEGVKYIGESAFSDTALPAVAIPNSVTSIGKFAYSTMPELVSVSIGSNTATIDESAFYGNVKLETVTFAENSVLKTLGASAFASNKLLKSVIIPAGTETIGDKCFGQCEALESVTLPDSITSIGSAAFNNTQLYINSPTDFVYIGNWIVAVKNKDTLDAITAESIREGTVGICDFCFFQAPVLKSIILQSTVSILGKYCFAYSPELERFESGSGLRIIDSSAFAYCQSLYRIQMKSGLKTIGNYAFLGCSMVDNPQNVSTMLVPDTVEKIGKQAFYNTKLWSAPDSYGIIYAGKWVVGFDESKAPDNIELKTNVIGVSDYAFMSCETLESLVNLSKCRFIGEGAFSYCTSLGTVVLNQNLHVIENFTFYSCTSLFRIAFPEGLYSIGESAFYKCELLSSLDFTTTDADFTSIGNRAFYGCLNLRELMLGNSVKNIGSYAFYKCTALLGEPVSAETPEVYILRIPGSVETLGDHAFARCSAAMALVIEDGVTEIPAYAFYKCALSNVTIPDTVTVIRNSAFYGTAIQTLSLGEGVETIEQYAFFNLHSLVSLELPSSLKTIEKYAFKGCDLLTNVIIPKNITEIMASAFYGCKNATFYIESGADTTGWNLRWNASSRPVVMDVVLTDSSDYITSVTVSEGSLKNTVSISDAIVGINPPTREGYVFSGWKSETSDKLYSAEDIATVPAGTVLTAVWAEDDRTEDDNTETDNAETDNAETD